MTGVLIKKGTAHRAQGEQHVKMKAEIMVMLLQAEEHQRYTEYKEVE